MDQHANLRLTNRQFIPSIDIVYLQSDINYTDVHTLDNRKHTSGFTLKILANRITDTNFLRINKGLIINRQYVKEVSSMQKEAFVLMTNGTILPVSRRKYNLLLESLIN